MVMLQVMDMYHILVMYDMLVIYTTYYRGYNFWCHCPRCQYEGDGPDKCTECSREAKEDGKEKFAGKTYN